MTRVESVVTPPVPSSPRRRWRLPRVQLGVIIFLIIVGAIVYWLGRIGFIELPFMASAVPRRQVTSALATDVRALLSTTAGATTGVTATITEAELTGWLRQQVGSLRPALVQSPQLTIEPTDIEIFGQLAARPTMSVTLLLRVETPDAGSPQLVTTSCKIGLVPIPAWTCGVLADQITTKILNPLLAVPKTKVELAFGKLLYTPAL